MSQFKPKYNKVRNYHLPGGNLGKDTTALVANIGVQTENWH